MKKLFTLLISLLTGIAGVYAQTGSRLYASSVQSINAGGVLQTTDSNTYTFSYNRGGDLVTGIKYDTCNIVSYDTATHSFKPSNRSYQLFDPSDYLVSLTSQVYSAGAWTNRSKTVHERNAAGFDTAVTDYQWVGSTQSFRPASRDLYRLNGSNAATTTIHQVYDTVAMAFVNYNRRLIYYNTSNDISIDTVQFWTASTSSWKNDQANYYMYSGRLLNAVRDTFFNPVSGGYYGRYTRYTYNSGNFLISAEALYRTSGGPYALFDSTYYSNLSPGGHAGTAIVYYYGDPAFGNAYQYNGLEQLTSSQFFTYVNGVQQPAASGTKYYYEAYSLAVAPATAGSMRIDVYPNPSINSVSIRTDNISSPVTIQLFDMGGSLYYSAMRLPSATPEMVVSTAGLPDGLYTVVVSGAQGRMAARLAVQH